MRVTDLTEQEVQLSARLVIADYGADAESLARMRVNERYAMRDLPGIIAWARILKAVLQIRQREFKPT